MLDLNIVPSHHRDKHAEQAIYVEAQWLGLVPRLLGRLVVEWLLTERVRLDATAFMRTKEYLRSRIGDPRIRGLKRMSEQRLESVIHETAWYGMSDAYDRQLIGRLKELGLLAKLFDEIKNVRPTGRAGFFRGGCPGCRGRDGECPGTITFNPKTGRWRCSHSEIGGDAIDYFWQRNCRHCPMGRFGARFLIAQMVEMDDWPFVNGESKSELAKFMEGLKVVGFKVVDERPKRTGVTKPSLGTGVESR